MDVVKKVVKEPIAKLTTTNLNQNILVQGALFSAGALGAEYADTFLRDAIAKIPTVLPIDPIYLVQLAKMGISVVSMAFLKQPMVQTVLFGVFAQSMLIIVRQLLGKYISPVIPVASTATKLALTPPVSTYGQWG